MHKRISEKQEKNFMQTISKKGIRNMAENKPITVEYLGSAITFDSIDEMARSLKETIKQLPKNSIEYAQLRMIQLKYNI